MANTVRLSSGGMQALLKSDEVRAVLRQHAEAAAQRARSIAPVKTGTYRDSIHVVEDTTDRAVARVVTSDPKGNVIESQMRVLGRSLGGGA